MKVGDLVRLKPDTYGGGTKFKSRNGVIARITHVTPTGFWYAVEYINGDKGTVLAASCNAITVHDLTDEECAALMRKEMLG